jgi:hypothetical protein
MVKGTAIKEIRFKDGHRILKGETLMINWPDPRKNPSRAEVLHKDRSLPAQSVPALGWIGLSCTEKELAEAAMDSVCGTPSGATVEPDGVDSQGVPSWLMIHGLI